MALRIGIDIGGTFTKIGLFQEQKLIHTKEIPTRTAGKGSGIVPDITTAMRIMLEKGKPLLEKEPFVSIGAAFPGALDESGTCCLAVNLGWEHYPLAQTLAGEFSVPVFLLNDSNAAALGEGWLGAAKGTDNYVLVTLGTGVGAGIVLNGKLYPGAHGSAGEVGHIPVDPTETAVCSCGSYGCLEQYASATGLLRMCKKTVDQLANAGERVPHALKEAQDVKTVFDEAKRGNPIAVSLIEVYSRYLGRGLAVIGSLLDPELLLLGGGIAKAGDFLFERVRRAYRETTYPNAKLTPILPAALMENAGITGAVRYAIMQEGV